MLYNDWLGDIAKAFEARVADIKAVHGFENGDEFEIALAKLLRDIIPPRYGICRGYVVARDGDKEGDDLIVYDKSRFPVLRLLGDDLGRLQQVPAEAVLAYIECKHTLSAGKAKDRRTLRTALEQVDRVRRVLNKRPTVPLTEIAPGVSLGPPFGATPRFNSPPMRNPSYVAIWGRHLDVDADEGIDRVIQEVGTAKLDGKFLPDAILGGPLVTLPVVAIAASTDLQAFMFGLSEPLFVNNVSAPFGIALAHMLFAIERIYLGEIPWAEMLIQKTRGPGVENIRIDPTSLTPRP